MSSNAAILAGAQKEIDAIDDSNKKFIVINNGNKKPILYNLLNGKTVLQTGEITYPQSGKFKPGSELKDVKEVVIPNLDFGTKIIVFLKSTTLTGNGTFYLGPRKDFIPVGAPKSSNKTKKSNNNAKAKAKANAANREAAAKRNAEVAAAAEAAAAEKVKADTKAKRELEEAAKTEVNKPNSDGQFVQINEKSHNTLLFLLNKREYTPGLKGEININFKPREVQIAKIHNVGLTQNKKIVVFLRPNAGETKRYYFLGPASEFVEKEWNKVSLNSSRPLDTNSKPSQILSKKQRLAAAIARSSYVSETQGSPTKSNVNAKRRAALLGTYATRKKAPLTPGNQKAVLSPLKVNSAQQNRIEAELLTLNSNVATKVDPAQTALNTARKFFINSGFELTDPVINRYIRTTANSGKFTAPEDLDALREKSKKEKAERKGRGQQEKVIPFRTENEKIEEAKAEADRVEEAQYNTKEQKKQAAQEAAIKYFREKGLNVEKSNVKEEIKNAFNSGEFIVPKESYLEELRLTNSEKEDRRRKQKNQSILDDMEEKINESKMTYVEIPNGALKEALKGNATNQYSNIDVPVGNGKGKKFTLQRYSDLLKTRNIISIIDPKDGKPKMFIGPKVIPPVEPVSSKPTRIEVANETNLSNILSKANNTRFLNTPNELNLGSANSVKQPNNGLTLDPVNLPSPMSTNNKNAFNLGSESVNLPNPTQQINNGLNLGSESVNPTPINNGLNLGSEPVNLPVTNPRVKVIIPQNKSRLPSISSLKNATTLPRARATIKNSINMNANVFAPKKKFNRTKGSRFTKTVESLLPETTPTPIPAPGPIKGVKQTDSYLVSYSILLAFQSTDRFVRIEDKRLILLIINALQDPNTQIHSGFIMKGDDIQSPADKLIFNITSNNSKNSKAAKASSLLMNILEKINRIIIKDKLNNLFMGPEDDQYFQTRGKPKKVKVLSQKNADNIFNSLPSDERQLVNSNKNPIGNLKAAIQQSIRVIYNSDGSIESITPIREPFDYTGMEQITNSKDPNITVMYKNSTGKLYTEFALPEVELTNSTTVAIGGTRKRKSFQPTKTRRRR